MPDVSIIIVNYNTGALLRSCLQSIYAKTHGIHYEVIVVDNASSDGSKELVGKDFPQLKWIACDSNLGFGRANNLGAQQALGKYLLFLNADTLLMNNAVAMFFCYMEDNARNDSLGAIGGWLLSVNGTPNFSHGSFPSPLSEIGYLWKRVFSTPRDSIETTDVDFVSGADLFVPRHVFMDMKGFDPEIFLYYEETDLQYRMSRLGLKRRIIKGPEIVHLEGGSFDKCGLSCRRFMMAQTSFNHYITKHYSGISYVAFRLTMILLRVSVMITTDWSWSERIRAYSLVLKGSKR